MRCRFINLQVHEGHASENDPPEPNSRPERPVPRPFCEGERESHDDGEGNGPKRNERGLCVCDEVDRLRAGEMEQAVDQVSDPDDEDRELHMKYLAVWTKKRRQNMIFGQTYFSAL